ncbi:Metallo-dependent phosphatase-like protein [Globomyces pollinis-pini]|nr:Metallo-dependent phosphatase-like protein [Globomyces pollinis-pini]
MLILIIGDFHIPERQIDLPVKFKKLLVPGKIQVIIPIGDVSTQTMEYLSTICPVIQKSKIAEYEGFKIGVQGNVLDNNDVSMKESIVRSMTVDILLSGGTHEFQAFEKNGKFYINPGSATGAFSMYVEEVTPSFVLMDLSPVGFSLYIYKLIDGQVKVEKLDYIK